MTKLLCTLFSLFIIFTSSAQTTITGKVTDERTGESLIGATVIYGKGKGTATDFNGDYSFSIQREQEVYKYLM